MPSDAPIQFAFSGLPGGSEYCFTTPQRFALDITAGLAGYLPGQYTTILNSETEPAVADRDKLWHNPSDGRVYHYDGGWINKNPEEANGDARRIFTGAESDIWSYDGGDGNNPSINPPTDKTGAMWERDTTFDFRMPLGVGTSPAPHSTTVAVGATGGEEKHTLTIPELPEHSHGMPLGEDEIRTNVAPGGGSNNDDSSSGGGFYTKATFQPSGEDEPHNNLPPFIGVYFIRRTNRIWYVA